MKRFLAAGMLMILFSCSNSQQKDTALASDTAAVPGEQTSAVNLVDSKAQTIYNDYISLKNSLVATKYEEAQQSAEKLKASLSNYPGCENTALIAGKIFTAKDIPEQRKEFTLLSSDVIAMFKHTDLTSGSIYVQHCPMANNGNGGDWLSSEKKIQNPYYGDEMLECGAVLETIN
ncbi:MAG: DUF3347 domain-containing protein [Pedobacter sp.]